jgi:two-component system nitrate/nitrite response regulator NarL
MRLVLCDDNRILCEALGAALGAQGHQVVATATTADAGITAVTSHQPDVILLDLRFPSGDDGLAAAEVILQRCPRTKVLMLSGISDPEAWSGAARIGVAGFLRKDSSVRQIAHALDVIAAGGRAFDPALSRTSGRRKTGDRHAFPACELTPREKEVLRRMVSGQGTGQMAREMNIAISTLRTYVQNVFTKLGVHSRLQAAALAARQGLLGEDPAA